MRIGIFDGNNIFCRQYFKLKKLTNGGAFGFIKFLMSEELPELNKKIVVFDGGKSQRRMELYPEYKQNRAKKDPEEFQEMINQMEIIKDFFEVFGIIGLQMKHVEGDDIIAVLAKYLRNKKTKKNKDYELTIFSTDKDFYQLLQYKNINIFDLRENEYLDKNKLNFDFEEYVLYKSIVGDSSDGIDGVKGIGDKRAKQILEEIKNKTFENSKYYDTIKQSQNIIERNKKMIDFKYIPEELEDRIIKKFKKKYLELKESKVRGKQEIFDLKINYYGFESLFGRDIE